MFFKTKRNPRKTTRQTLNTEQLEPKAMFNAAPLQAEIGFEDRLSDDYDVNDAVLQVRSSQSVTCNNGFSGGGNYIFNADGIWTNGGASTLRIAGTAGPETATSLRSENRFVFEIPKNDSGITLHASANPHAGPEGFMKLGDIKGEFQLTQPLTGSGGSTSLRSENRFVFEAPKNDGLLVPAGYDFASFGLEANERVGGVGKGTFTTGAGGDSIVHPQYNVGEDGRMIVHPQYSVAGSTRPDGGSIFMPMPEPDISIVSGAKANGYAEAVGLDSSTLDTSSTVQPPVENVSMDDHIQAPRSQAFARMGR